VVLTETKWRAVNGNYSRYVYVYNKTRETFVATEAAVADNYLRRLIGLLGKNQALGETRPRALDHPISGRALHRNALSDRSCLLSKRERCVHVEEHFRPFRVSKVSLKATSVLELPPHTIYRTGTQVGDVLEITKIR